MLVVLVKPQTDDGRSVGRHVFDDQPSAGFRSFQFLIDRIRFTFYLLKNN